MPCRLLVAVLCCGLFVLGCNEQDGLKPVVTSIERKPLATETVTEPATEQVVVAQQPAAKPPDAASAADHGGAGTEAKKAFADWPKPQAVLVISGEQLGYIEPCGCAGLENQKGGLSRRHTMLKQLAAEGWPVAALDVGNQIKRIGAQQEIKFHATIEGLQTMGYDAVAFGPEDLRLPTGELISDVANEANKFVAANVKFAGFEELTPSFRILEIGGRKIGVTAILGKKAQEKINSAELTISDPETALAAVLPEMAKQADFLVLLSHATRDESLALAAKFPKLDLVATAGGADEPPAEPRVIGDSKTWLVEVGQKGMYVAAVGLFADEKTPRRYQRLPLDKRFADSKDMHQLMVAYQSQIRDRGFEGLGLTPVAHRSGRSFVGSQACAKCHTKAFKIWEESPHAHATETLVKLDPPRHFDAECVSCHTTGWEPQKYFPFRSGFASLEKTPLLKQNGCENCHGPGSAHVAAENDKSLKIEDLKPLREQLRVPLAQAEATCLKCHDHDNSPDFDFSTYWETVKHYGKD